MTVPVRSTSVGPDFSALGDTPEVERIIGALLTYGLLIAVLMLIGCAIGWAIGSATGNWQAASKSKSGLLVALGGAVLLGGALAWAKWLLDLGPAL
jgi:hypothetical protein